MPRRKPSVNKSHMNLIRSEIINSYQQSGFRSEGTALRCASTGKPHLQSLCFPRSAPLNEGSPRCRTDTGLVASLAAVVCPNQTVWNLEPSSMWVCKFSLQVGWEFSATETQQRWAVPGGQIVVTKDPQQTGKQDLERGTQILASMMIIN